MDLYARVRRLDTLYLAADHASNAWFGAKRRANKERLRRIAAKKWAAYRRLVNAWKP